MDIEQIEKYVVPLVVTYVPRVLGLLLALLAAKVVSGWAERLTLRSMEKAKADVAVSKFLANLARWAVMGLGVITALGYVGIETASFAAVIAAGGLAVGLAFQGTLSNFASGVMLLIFRPFKVDDVVSGGGETGKIIEIGIFTTEMTTPDNQRVIIPNSAMFGGNITNITHHPIRRVSIDVGTDYGADLDKTRDVLEAAIKTIPGMIQDPAPQVFLGGLGGSSIDWSMRVWCKTEDFWDVHQATIVATKKSLDAAGIGIPFPQQDVHVDSVFLDALRKRA